MQISHDTIVGSSEERRPIVLVDHHDVFGSLASDQVLNGATDSTSDVQVWSNAISGETDLVGMRPPTIIGSHTRTSYSAPQQAGQFFQSSKAFLATDSPPASHDN